MKKIVALVLCLALALSLCSVAMAKTLFLGSDLQHEVEGDSKWDVIVANKGQADDKEFTTYELTYDGSKTGNYYVATDAASAEYTLVDGNKVVHYLRAVEGKDAGETWTTTAKEIKVYDARLLTEEIMDEENWCGKIFGIPEATYYQGANGSFYLADVEGDKLLNVDGKAVSVFEIKLIHVGTNEEFEAAQAAVYADLEPALALVDHFVVFDWELNDEGEYVFEDVECDRCEKAMAYKTSAGAALAAWGVNGYHDVKGEPDDGFQPTIWVPCALNVQTVGAASGSASGTTIESAKTFDAGIALYAGMALASVAGSAVVIGKKKEF